MTTPKEDSNFRARMIAEVDRLLAGIQAEDEDSLWVAKDFLRRMVFDNEDDVQVSQIVCLMLKGVQMSMIREQKKGV